MFRNIELRSPGCRRIESLDGDAMYSKELDGWLEGLGTRHVKEANRGLELELLSTAKQHTSTCTF